MIFVDTWAWVALALTKDQYHRIAITAHRHFLRQRKRYLTTDFVLSELIAHLYTTLAPELAQSFVNSLFAAADSGVWGCASCRKGPLLKFQTLL